MLQNVRNQKKSGVEGGSGWTSVETLFYVFLEFMKEVASPHWGSWVQQIRCLGLLGDSFSICLCACPSPYVRISWLYTVSTNAGNAPNLCGALSERILGQFPGPPWHHTASLKHFFACVVNFLCQFSLHHLRPRPFDFHSALLWNSASAGQSFAHRFYLQRGSLEDPMCIQCVRSLLLGSIERIPTLLREIQLQPLSAPLDKSRIPLHWQREESRQHPSGSPLPHE